MIGYVSKEDNYIAASTDNINEIKCYEGTKIYLYDIGKTKIYHDGEWVDYISSSGGGSGVIENGSITTEMFAENAKAPLATKADEATTVTGATTIGLSVLKANNAAAVRTAIGAGTSNLAIGTTSTTAKVGNYAPTSADITDATDIGKSILTATDATTARTEIGAGTSNLTIGTTSSTAKAGDYAPPNASTSTAGLVKQAVAQADSEATTIEELLADFNTLLANLRTSGVIAT